MKVLIQHTHRRYEISGVLTYVESIVPELESRGITTRVISTKESSVWDWISAIGSSDIVHLNSNNLPFALLCKLLGKKTIIKYHYLFYLSTHFEYTKVPLLKRLFLEFKYTLPGWNYPLRWKLHTVVKWIRFSMRFLTALIVDRHTACSNFLADSLSFPWHVETLVNPIVVAIDESTDKNASNSDQIFVYVGRIYGDKGVDLLIKAAKQLYDSGYEFRVWILGRGGAIEDMKTLVNAFELDDRIEFWDGLDRSQILERLRSALALVVPSRWQEPAGYVTLEASSVQTCSIVANVGGLPEMAGPHSLRFDREDVEGLASAMRWCLEHPEECRDRGARSQQFVREQFSPEKVVDQFLDICRSLGVESEV